MDKHDQRKGTAIAVLTYYLRESFEESGIDWNSDNDTEVAEIVECIVNEATYQIRQELTAIRYQLNQIKSQLDLEEK